MSEPTMADVKVPDIGDVKDVAVIELLEDPCDTIKADQSLITVESDKASMEGPSSVARVLKELKVNIGDLIAKLESASGACADICARSAARVCFAGHSQYGSAGGARSVTSVQRQSGARLAVGAQVRPQCPCASVSHGSQRGSLRVSLEPQSS